MLYVRKIRNAVKEVQDWGKWQVGGMSASTFPLSKRKGHSLRFGTAYRWRIIRFLAADTRYRLLLAYSLGKEQFKAILASEGNNGLTVIAAYEFHGTHPGWHVSAACGDLTDVPAGVLVGP